MKPSISTYRIKREYDFRLYNKLLQMIKDS